VKARSELSAREIELVHQTIQRRLGDTSIPTLPQVAMRIIELVGDPNSSMQDFAEVIKTDQALTGRLLRMVNSAAFGQSKPVTRIERATILLGLDKLKAIALGFHLSRAAASDDGEFSFKRMWTQALFRGWLALRITEDLKREISGEAFVIGLMSDAGIPMMPKLLGGAYGDVAPLAQSPAKHYQSEFQNLPFTHVDLAVVLAKMWRLPDVLARPIATHHSRPTSMDPRDPASVLAAVSYFVCALPLDADGDAEITSALQTVSERLLGVAPERMKSFLNDAAINFKACRGMFSHLIDDQLAVEHILDEANRHLDAELEVAAAKRAADDAKPVDVLRFQAAGLVLEMEAAENHRVTVFITDSNGNRLLSERVDPAKQSEADIRQALMLDDATPDEVKAVMDGLGSLAAAA